MEILAMHQRLNPRFRESLTVAALVLTTVAVGQTYEISRKTVDGGGGMRSTGGSFELSGTIGQPDAGALTGGPFVLNGGFWFPLAASDCNVDGIVDLYDYVPFVDCVTGPDSGSVSAGCTCADQDQDGDVDLSDWGALQMEFGR